MATAYRAEQVEIPVPANSDLEYMLALFEFPHAEETLADVQHREDDPRGPYFPFRPPKFNPRAVLETAKSFVMTEVNAHLIEHGVTARLQPDPRGEPRFYVVPRSFGGSDVAPAR